MIQHGGINNELPLCCGEYLFVLPKKETPENDLNKQ